MAVAAWNEADVKCLGADDFQDVRKEVATLTGLWDGMALCLGLTKDHVREIDLAYRGDPSRCLDDVIERWLNQNYNWEKFGVPSWRGLVTAVADGSGGKNPALAKKIAEKHKKPMSSPAPPPVTFKPGGAVGIKALCNDLAKIAHKWHPLGLQLGVEAHELDKIRGDGNEAQTCLSTTLCYWLSNNTDACKSDLVDMLKSNVICEQQLARKLQSNKDIPDGKLTCADLAGLVTFLDPVASKWEDVGIQLDVDTRKLDYFKSAGSGNLDKFLRIMLTKVKQRIPPKTVRDLCTALSSPTIGEKALAGYLSTTYTNQGKEYLFETDNDDERNKH
eukprot:Em0004g960a